MHELVKLVGSAPPFPWAILIFGLVALVLGLPIVIWPQKATDLIRMINQALLPITIPRPPVAATVAFGCLSLIIATAMFGSVLANL
jgi:hypothetical protein